MKCTDLFLVDIKHIDDEKHRSLQAVQQEYSDMQYLMIKINLYGYAMSLYRL